MYTLETFHGKLERLQDKAVCIRVAAAISGIFPGDMTARIVDEKLDKEELLVKGNVIATLYESTDAPAPAPKATKVSTK